MCSAFVSPASLILTFTFVVQLFLEALSPELLILTPEEIKQQLLPIRSGEPDDFRSWLDRE
jgi:hypothetical protein